MKRPSLRALRASFPLLAVLPIAALDTACSEDDDACTGAGCPGAPGSPTFAGVTSVSPDRTGERLRVTWSPAVDDKTPVEKLRYRVYVSTRAGKATLRVPVATTDPGATSLYVGVTPLSTTHHVVVRAVDADGNEDGNRVEKSALATGDTAPPAFAGLKAVRTEAGAGVTLTWDAATDDRTAPEGMRYVVHADGPTGRVLATVEGRTETTLRGIGAAGEKIAFAVRALDAADNSDANNATLEGVLGPDSLAPTFGGCVTAEPLGSKVLRVTWAEAKDDSTAHADLTYDVFAATSSGAQNFAAPSATITGGTEVVVRDLQPSTLYHVVCRVRDRAGNAEKNLIEKTATTTTNVVPPTFGTPAGVLSTVNREVSFTWPAGTDDATSADKLVYVVYEAHGSDPFDFTRPKAVSEPGATSLTVRGLPSRTSFRWIVRARDLDYNEDANTTEITGRTQTSYALDVAPLFAQNCAVVGCHASPNVGGGISFSLSEWNAYESIVNVASAQRALMRVLPGDATNSYLFQKVTLQPPAISFNPMPAPGTGNVLTPDQVDILRTWINEGALRN